MSEMKNTETLSLDTSKQKKVSKQMKALQKKIQEVPVTVEGKIQMITPVLKRGLLFLSHLPHGFFEDELKNYFQQFGKVTNVQICRSRKTGRSKGYAYIEFLHPEVAKIAAETMNNYLMFKKRVTAEYIPNQKRPKGLFVGKSCTATKFASKIRRQKQYQANLNVGEGDQMRRISSRISKLDKKLKRLQGLGLDTTFKLIDVTLMKKEKSSDVETHTEIFQEFK